MSKVLKARTFNSSPADAPTASTTLLPLLAV
jgi:hypothetical protein